MTPNALNIDLYSTGDAASLLGLSEEVIRLHCRSKKCQSRYVLSPGKKRGYYLISKAGIEWLRKNIRPRTRKQKVSV
jgi:hypothetical protein